MNIKIEQIFDDLTPNIDSSQNDVYSASLSWALKNNKIKNIAITGPYGSGKSSILKSFEAKNTDYQYLNISLATFYDSTATLTDDQKKEQYKLIEISILQQILYKVKGEEIPNSRFKRISNVDSYSQLYFVLEILAAVIGITFISAPKFITNTDWWKFYYSKESNFFAILIAVLIFPIIIHLAKKTVESLGALNVSKINLSNNGSIELTGI